MPIIITPGLGGILQFQTQALGVMQDFVPLAPSLISTNLSLNESRELRFWTLAPGAQVETLASAYHHLSRQAEPNADLLGKLGAMIQRFHAGESSIATDNFILINLMGEVRKLKDSVPPTVAKSDRPEIPSDTFVPGSSTTPLPPTETTRRRPTPRRENSLRLYTDGKGGYFPPLWGGMPEILKLEMKSLAYQLDGKMSDLSDNDEAHAEFLSSSFTGWILALRDELNKETISLASIRHHVAIISEMAVFMADPSLLGSVGTRFWGAFGANAEARMVINRLANARMLPTALGDEEKAAVEKAMFDVDVAFLRAILRSLPGNTPDAEEESSDRNENYGDLLARKLGEVLGGIPLSEKADLSGAGQVNLTSALSVLRILSKELAGEPSPAVHAFLKKLLPRHMLQLTTVIALGRRP